MKKLFNILAIIATIGLLFTSCDLDKYPNDQFDIKDAYTTVEDARYHRNGVLARLRSSRFGIYAQTSELMSDLFNATTNYGNNQGPVHRVELGMLTDADNVGALWSGCYGGINTANIFLDNVGMVPLSTASDSAAIKQYKAEARYVRAFIYYVLITYFGEDYEPTGDREAYSVPGVPIVTKFDIDARPVRPSLGDVYDFILNELEEIEPMFTPGGKSNSEDITQDAILALKSKIQLLMHDFDGALITANRLINSGRYPLVADGAAYRRMWVNDESTEDILTLFASVNEPVDNMATFSNYNQGYTDQVGIPVYVPNYIPTKKVVDTLYANTNDYRSQVFILNGSGNSIFVLISGEKEEVKLLNKFPGNPALWTANYTNYQHKPKVARIAEQYLIAAEALSHSDKGAALAMLNKLRANRGVANLTTWSNDNHELQDEWAREMIGEGVRLECLKRWRVGYAGRKSQDGGTVATVQGADFTLRVMDPNNPDWYRFTLPIPQADLQTNLNMEQTPEWVNPQ
ncbi:MAG: RagB/SusD family nutrient uptake outer membrane protein [Bacteroidales bacterium]|jgi:hypothetical protein|nr:RagB/SusD family nutrient uptake outer membrane protein [Bacteroidales bacterium]